MSCSAVTWSIARRKQPRRQKFDKGPTLTNDASKASILVAADWACEREIDEAEHKFLASLLA